MNESVEKQRQEELALQKKQLFAQRVTAAASVATALKTAQTAETVERMRREAGAAAEATALHQLRLEVHQAEMAVRQEQLAEEQRTTNLRHTLLATVPLLKEDERVCYLTEQLLPVVEKARAKNVPLSLGVVVSACKFTEFACHFLATEPDVKEYMENAKNPKKRLVAATKSYNEANKKLKEQDSALGCMAAAFSIVVVYLGLSYLCRAFFPVLTTNSPSGATLDAGAKMAILAAAVVVTALSLKGAKKLVSRVCGDKVSGLAKGVSVLKAKVSSEEKALAMWNVNRADTWNTIKNKLLDAYFASDLGKGVMELDIFHIVMSSWMSCVEAEQSFLPPSVRPSDEQWRSALAPKVEPEAEAAKQRLAKLKSIFLRRLTPKYKDGTCELADLEVRFADVEIEVTAATPEEPMSEKGVHELVATLTDLLQTIEAGGGTDETTVQLKETATRQLEYLRSAIATNSPAWVSRLNG